MPTPPAAPTSFADQSYWTERYAAAQMGWDIGYPSPPLRSYVDTLADRSIAILIPGAGNAYEAEYLWRQGFQNVKVLDIARPPLDNLARRLPDFPPANLLHENFFDHRGQYDLILEQTFFCSFPPTRENRRAYVEKMHELLRPGGKLVGLLFAFPLDPERNRPPYGGSAEEYRQLLEARFSVKTLAPATDSIPERAGNELFFVAKKEEETH